MEPFIKVPRKYAGCDLQTVVKIAGRSRGSSWGELHAPRQRPGQWTSTFRMPSFSRNIITSSLTNKLLFSQFCCSGDRCMQSFVAHSQFLLSPQDGPWHCLERHLSAAAATANHFPLGLVFASFATVYRCRSGVACSSQPRPAVSFSSIGATRIWTGTLNRPTRNSRMASLVTFRPCMGT